MSTKKINKLFAIFFRINKFLFLYYLDMFVESCTGGELPFTQETRDFVVVNEGGGLSSGVGLGGREWWGCSRGEVWLAAVRG